MVLWRCSRHGVRSGQGRLRVLQMLLKSGGVPAALSGAMISMGRTLEKLGPALYSPEWEVILRGRSSAKRSSRKVTYCALRSSSLRRRIPSLTSGKSRPTAPPLIPPPWRIPAARLDLS